MREKHHTLVLKIGGSIVSHKERAGVFLRRTLIARIGNEIRKTLELSPNTRLILIHGAGAGGHQLAKKYDLGNGVGTDNRKWQGAILTRIANQELNLELFKILAGTGLRIVPVHTASVAILKGGDILTFGTEIIDEALRNGCIPFLYGELVFDTELGMSILSGDTSTVFLAKKFDAYRVLFASDIDGIFDKDPHRYKDAEIIKETTLSNFLENKDIALSGSHSIDVTGGLAKKVSELVRIGLPSSLKTITVFNGLESDNFGKALSGKRVGTVLKV